MRTAQCSAVVLGVVVLNQLRLGRALSEALRLGRGARRQEPQLALQVEQLLIRVGLHFDRLELLEQRVARQILVHLGRRDELALFVLDLLRHLLERLERALVADRRHRFLNALVRLGTLLARDQDVLLALGFLDPIVELAQRDLELVRFLAVLDPRIVQLQGGLRVLVVAQQRLLRQVVAPFLDGQHGALLPVLGGLFLLVDLGPSRFSSAIAAATCCFALASWVRMSTISWFSIFSGFSAREIRSLMFDRMSVERRSKIPMMTLYVLAGPHCPAPNLRPRCSASSRSAKSNRSASSEICPCSCETCSSSAAMRCGSSPIIPTTQRPRARMRTRSAKASPTGERNSQRRPTNTTTSATIGMTWLSRKFRSRPGGVGGIGGMGPCTMTLYASRLP